MQSDRVTRSQASSSEMPKAVTSNTQPSPAKISSRLPVKTPTKETPKKRGRVSKVETPKRTKNASPKAASSKNSTPDKNDAPKRSKANTPSKVLPTRTTRASTPLKMVSPQKIKPNTLLNIDSPKKMRSTITEVSSVTGTPIRTSLRKKSVTPSEVISPKTRKRRETGDSKQLLKNPQLILEKYSRVSLDKIVEYSNGNGKTEEKSNNNEACSSDNGGTIMCSTDGEKDKLTPSQKGVMDTGKSIQRRNEEVSPKSQNNKSEISSESSFSDVSSENIHLRNSFEGIETLPDYTSTTISSQNIFKESKSNTNNVSPESYKNAFEDSQAIVIEENVKLPEKNISFTVEEDKVNDITFVILGNNSNSDVPLCLVEDAKSEDGSIMSKENSRNKIVDESNVSVTSSMNKTLTEEKSSTIPSTTASPENVVPNKNNQVAETDSACESSAPVAVEADINSKFVDTQPNAGSNCRMKAADFFFNLEGNQTQSHLALNHKEGKDDLRMVHCGSNKSFTNHNLREKIVNGKAKDANLAQASSVKELNKELTLDSIYTATDEPDTQKIVTKVSEPREQVLLLDESSESVSPPRKYKRRWALCLDELESTSICKDVDAESTADLSLSNKCKIETNNAVQREIFAELSSDKSSSVIQHDTAVQFTKESGVSNNGNVDTVQSETLSSHNAPDHSKDMNKHIKPTVAYHESDKFNFLCNSNTSQEKESQYDKEFPYCHNLKEAEQNEISTVADDSCSFVDDSMITEESLPHEETTVLNLEAAKVNLSCTSIISDENVQNDKSMITEEIVQYTEITSDKLPVVNTGDVKKNTTPISVSTDVYISDGNQNEFEVTMSSPDGSDHSDVLPMASNLSEQKKGTSGISDISKCQSSKKIESTPSTGVKSRKSVMPTLDCEGAQNDSTHMSAGSAAGISDNDENTGEKSILFTGGPVDTSSKLSLHKESMNDLDCTSDSSYKDNSYHEKSVHYASIVEPSRNKRRRESSEIKVVGEENIFTPREIKRRRLCTPTNLKNIPYPNLDLSKAKSRRNEKIIANKSSIWIVDYLNDSVLSKCTDSSKSESKNITENRSGMWIVTDLDPSVNMESTSKSPHPSNVHIGSTYETLTWSELFVKTNGNTFSVVSHSPSIKLKSSKGKRQRSDTGHSQVVVKKGKHLTEFEERRKIVIDNQCNREMPKKMMEIEESRKKYIDYYSGRAHSSSKIDSVVPSNTCNDLEPVLNNKLNQIKSPSDVKSIEKSSDRYIAKIEFLPQINGYSLKWCFDKVGIKNIEEIDLSKCPRRKFLQNKGYGTVVFSSFESLADAVKKSKIIYINGLEMWMRPDNSFQSSDCKMLQWLSSELKNYCDRLGRVSVMNVKF